MLYEVITRELLAALEAGLLELERHPDDAELIGQVFRALHTIKGSGAMFGFDRIASFTHDIETVFDLVRDGELQVSQELITLTLKARDQIQVLINAAAGETPADESQLADLTEAFLALIPRGKQEGGQHVELADDTPGGGRRKTYRIRFVPGREIFFRRNNFV